ncbi:hypothetical protein D3C71_2247740 [compost metagenome]
MPSSAVTTVVSVFSPTERGIEPEAVPDVTATPLTVIVAPASVALGVTFSDTVALGTEAV